MHAVDVATGAEHAGFPVVIQGKAANDATHTFVPDGQWQRPGLLLLNGVVYAGFGSHCDQKPFEGWVAGVSAAGAVTTMWTAEAGQPSGGGEGAVWSPGGGLVSDGPGQILFSTGNGTGPPAPAAGSSPPRTLAQSVVRLTVQTNGSLKATSFFSPFNWKTANTTDIDVGSGDPVALPSPFFGTTKVPHVLVQIGKSGYLYVHNRDHLGGFAQGTGGSDAAVAKLGPFGATWGKPAAWPGNGGYIYVTTAAQGGKPGFLRAFKYGVTGSGLPTFSLAGSTSDKFGFSSSSPVVTSNGSSSGTAVLWVVWSPDGTGANAQLRAYQPVPVSGVLKPIFSAPIGTASKFLSPATDGNRVYVGTRDGHVLGFGGV
jgi:hypothetical protein